MLLSTHENVRTNTAAQIGKLIVKGLSKLTKTTNRRVHSPFPALPLEQVMQCEGDETLFFGKLHNYKPLLSRFFLWVSVSLFQWLNRGTFYY